MSDKGLNLAFPDGEPDHEAFEELGRNSGRVVRRAVPARRTTTLRGRLGSVDSRLARLIGDNKRTWACRTGLVLGIVGISLSLYWMLQ